MLWLALGASFFFLGPAREILASKEGRWDDGHILRLGDVESISERSGDDAYSRRANSPVASHAPLAAFGTARATATLGGVVALAGLPAAGYALHSLRIAVATLLSAGGASADVVQRQGRWKSDTYKGYVRSYGVDPKALSDMLADANA